MADSSDPSAAPDGGGFPLGPDSLTWKYFGDVRTGIRGYHTTIKGTDAEGRRYHALDPETFYWAHATFFMLILKTAEYFCGGLTEAEKRRLFDEHVQWYRMYGMSMRPVPESWEAFCEYWDDKCRDEL